MKINMGTADRNIRIVVAIAIAILYFMDVISGTTGIVLLVLATVFLITGFLRFCPLYLPFGLSTAKKESKGN